MELEKKPRVEGDGSSPQTQDNELFMGSTQITASQKTYIRIDQKCMHHLHHFFSSIRMQPSTIYL